MALKLFAYVLMSVADFVITSRLVVLGGMDCEGNPIAHAVLAAYGFSGMAAYKIACTAVVISVCSYLAVKSRKLGDRLAMLACFVLGAVVAYSSVLLLM
jgi:hypothetical protein